MTTHSVVVVGHADADGHLIAEQTRRNLELVEGFDVTVVVDPARTLNHKSWTKLSAIKEIDNADIVFFVDLMFGPATFAEEAQALVKFVRDRPEKRFFLIDHHPLPLRRLSSADNLRVSYRPDVFECAIGPRSGMMIVAALCENQGVQVADIKEPVHDVLARGVRRAAALGGELPGKKLSALLQSDGWDFLIRLGNDDKKHHRLPRGRRPRGHSESNELRALDQAATKLLSASADDNGKPKELNKGSTTMAYDLADVRYTYNVASKVRQRNTAVPSKDLEAIVTLLEVAAMSLTTQPGETFSLERLIAEAREIGGAGIELDERDIKIVMDKATFVERVGKELRLR